MTTLQGAGSVGVSPGEGEGATRGTRNSSAGLAAGGGPAAAGAGVVSGRRGEGAPRGGEAEGGTGWGCELEAEGGEGVEAEGRRSRRREGRGAMKEALLVQRIGIGAPSSITSFFAEQKGAPFPVLFSLRSRTRPLRFFFLSPYILHPLPFPAFTLARLRMCTWANEAFLCFGSEEEGEKCLFLPRCVCVRCAQSSSSSSWCLRRSSTTRHTYSSSVPPLPSPASASAPTKSGETAAAAAAVDAAIVARIHTRLQVVNAGERETRRRRRRRPYAIAASTPPLRL